MHRSTPEVRIIVTRRKGPNIYKWPRRREIKATDQIDISPSDRRRATENCGGGLVTCG